jgi:predicted PurR-regulated permease PerM
MNSRFQSLVYGSVFAAIFGWVLYIGKAVWVPIFFGAVVVYVIVGVTDALRRVPWAGPVLPLQIRYILSILFIGFAVLTIGRLVIANKDQVIALAPQYQEALLATIQKLAVVFKLETEPTWTTLRQDMLARINLKALLGSTLASVSSIAVTLVVVLLYTVFLLVEQHSFGGKLAQLSSDPRSVARIGSIIGAINRRIGTYLALKTMLSVLLGAVSWLIMLAFGLKFAAFWAVLIALLNFVPYVGSALGVLFPIIMALVQFSDPAPIVWLLAALVAVQFVIGNFLDPYVMGNSLNLSPFAILVSLAAWSELWGIAGAFLAVPITAAVVIVLSEFAGSRPIAVLLSRNGRL